MRINEIVDTEFKDVERKTPYDSYALLKQERRAARRGSPSKPTGWYSGGYQNPRDPHEYVKTTHKPSYLHDDAYYLYVTAISHLQKKNYRNPYFPVVYQVRVTSDPRGMDRPRYRIETLQNPANYPVEAIEGMVERMFVDPSIVLKSVRGSNPQRQVGDVWRSISALLDDCLGESNAEALAKIKDPLLQQALAVIHKILQKRATFEPDIHANNIMIRGTPVGPQLVLMDPISDAGASIVPDDDIDDHYEYDDHIQDDDEDEY
jgi:hypothetical protein